MEDYCLSAGEAVLAKMAQRASELQGLVGEREDLEKKQATFEAQAAKAEPGAINAEVVKVATIARNQAAQTIEDMKALEMWLLAKVPEVSDGNNFGVDVQNFVLGELKAIRTEVSGGLDTMSDYHQKRAASLEKIVRPKSTTTDSEDKTETEGDKTTVKKSKTVKDSSKAEAALPDYVKHIAALDVKEYYACYTRLVDMRNAYIKADLIMSKNRKRLGDPRGDGEGKRSNAMSMY